jgi:hypothetical protein
MNTRKPPLAGDDAAAPTATTRTSGAQTARLDGKSYRDALDDYAERLKSYGNNPSDPALRALERQIAEHLVESEGKPQVRRG